MCPLALIAGFVDAIAGGGGLISLPAYFFAGLPPHAAIATNKLSSTLGTLVATVRYALFGYMVKRFVVAGVACGLVGSAIGANLALLADATVLTVVMLVALPPVAFLVFRSKNLDRFAEHPLPPRRALAATALIALAVGVYDGFYGPGTGAILMLLLAADGSSGRSHGRRHYQGDQPGHQRRRLGGVSRQRCGAHPAWDSPPQPSTSPAIGSAPPSSTRKGRSSCAPSCSSSLSCSPFASSPTFWPRTSPCEAFPRRRAAPRARWGRARR